MFLKLFFVDTVDGKDLTWAFNDRGIPFMITTIWEFLDLSQHSWNWKSVMLLTAKMATSLNYRLEKWFTWPFVMKIRSMWFNKIIPKLQNRDPDRFILRKNIFTRSKHRSVGWLFMATNSKAKQKFFVFWIKINFFFSFYTWLLSSYFSFLIVCLLLPSKNNQIIIFLLRRRFQSEVNVAIGEAILKKQTKLNNETNKKNVGKE